MEADLKNKLQKVLTMVDAVEKRGTNETQKYKFVKAVDVAREVRKALIEQRVGFAYSIKEVKHWEKLRYDSNGVVTGVGMYMCQVLANVTFTDLDAPTNSPGSYATVEAVGWGSDPLDKAPYKAITGSLKYALRMQFLIPDEADPENDAGGAADDASERPQVQRQLRESVNQYDGPPVEAYASDDLSFLDDPNPRPDDRQVKTRPTTQARPQARPQVSKGPISDQQGKMLFAIAMSKQWAKEDYWSWINEQGYKKDRDIPIERFKDIKKALEDAQ